MAKTWVAVLIIILLNFPALAEGNAWQARFHSLPFYETNCLDAQTVCNWLELQGPSWIKDDKLYWRIIPSGKNPVQEDDFVYHDFPVGECRLERSKKTNLVSCLVSEDPSWIVEDCHDEKNETFAIQLYNQEAKMIATVEDKDFALSEFFDFKEAGNGSYHQVYNKTDKCK